MQGKRKRKENAIVPLRRSNRRAAKRARDNIIGFPTQPNPKRQKKGQSRATRKQQLKKEAKKRGEYYVAGEWLAIRVSEEDGYGYGVLLDDDENPPEQYWLCKSLKGDINKGNYSSSTFPALWIDREENRKQMEDDSTPKENSDHAGRVYVVERPDRVELSTVLCTTSLEEISDNTHDTPENESKVKKKGKKEEEKKWRLCEEEHKRLLRIIWEIDNFPLIRSNLFSSLGLEEIEENSLDEEEPKVEDNTRKSSRIRAVMAKKKRKEQKVGSQLLSWNRTLLDALIIHFLKEEADMRATKRRISELITFSLNEKSPMISAPSLFATEPIVPTLNENMENEEKYVDQGVRINTELQLSLDRLVESGYLREESVEKLDARGMPEGHFTVYSLTTLNGLKLKTMKDDFQGDKASLKKKVDATKIAHDNTRIAWNWKLRHDKERFAKRRNAFIQRNMDVFAPFIPGASVDNQGDAEPMEEDEEEESEESQKKQQQRLKEEEEEEEEEVEVKENGAKEKNTVDGALTQTTKPNPQQPYKHRTQTQQELQQTFFLEQTGPPKQETAKLEAHEGYGHGGEGHGFHIPYMVEAPRQFISPCMLQAQETVEDGNVPMVGSLPPHLMDLEVPTQLQGPDQILGPQQLISPQYLDLQNFLPPQQMMQPQYIEPSQLQEPSGPSLHQQQLTPFTQPPLPAQNSSEFQSQMPEFQQNQNPELQPPLQKIQLQLQKLKHQLQTQQQQQQHTAAQLQNTQAQAPPSSISPAQLMKTPEQIAEQNMQRQINHIAPPKQPKLHPVTSQKENESSFNIKKKTSKKGSEDAKKGNKTQAKPKRRRIRRKLKPLDQPKTIVNGTMRPYQREGLAWLVKMHNNGVGGILGDEMGLGKTLQIISFLAWLKETKNMGGPHLVITPLSVLSAWMNEFKRWCPSMRVSRFHGPKNERARLRKDVFNHGDFDVCVTTYESVLAAPHFFKSHFVWRYVIIDEAQRIKNECAQLSKCLRGVRAFNAFLLTGTPLQNNLHELWSLLNFLYPEVFVSSKKFDESFDLSKSLIQKDMLEKAGHLLDAIMLRRVKTDVEPNLPKKTETKVYVPLSAYQVFWYKRLLCKFSGVLDSTGNTVQGDDWKKLMSLLMQLRKVCNHPYMLPNSEPKPYTNGEHLIESSGKLAVVDKLLCKLNEDGHHVLIFSQFTSMLNILEDYSNYKGWRYARLDGSTPRVQRMLDIEAFNDPTEESEIFLYLISTRAGGLGINLASADTVIHYDSDWNPQADLQAQDRSHRIGQTKEVSVYRMVTEGTVEERIVNRAEQKLFMDSVVTGRGYSKDSPLQKLSKKELLPILTYGAERIFKIQEDDISQLNDSIDQILEKSKAHGTENIVNNDTVSTIQDLAINEFQGQSYTQTSFKNIAEEWKQRHGTLPEKRERKNRVVLVDNLPVLKSTIKKPSLRACSTNLQRRKTSKFTHQKFCLTCSKKGKSLKLCQRCPRAYHPSCLESSQKSFLKMWVCPQHKCSTCGRNASAAGGLLFRCLLCPQTFCEDHMPFGYKLIAKPKELLELGFRIPNNATYVLCSSDCISSYKTQLANDKQNGEKGRQSKWKSLSQPIQQKLTALQNTNEKIISLQELPEFQVKLCEVSESSSLLTSLYTLLCGKHDDGANIVNTSGSDISLKQRISTFAVKKPSSMTKALLAERWEFITNELHSYKKESLLLLSRLLGCKVIIASRGGRTGNKKRKKKRQ